MAVMTTSSVIGSFATLNEKGEVIAFDFNSFDKLVSDLVTERAKIRKDNADEVKAQKKASAEEKAVIGKEYFLTLKVGDHFFVEIGGNIVEVEKIATKSGSNNSASCKLVVSAGGKTDNRYPKFDKVAVPEEWLKARELAKAKAEAEEKAE